ncbi:cobalamin biosynthesis protein CbiG [Trinickia violacea]|uniref:Cobalamin biosynthesis protein CbiG n=1 Tax=Trinickia violacea TaxID=2571746 RepID=A0A4P8ITA7_9BURK|nr:cobalamin biosynthesis protein [Trinickia violacea]QCP52342.1 cobalamin biosynthesis protein CbiG [Trinickia violacea]
MQSHKPLTLGIGCRRFASAEQIDAAVRAALGAHSLDDVRAVATIDAKAQEPGLVAFCARHGLPLEVFTRAQIEALAATLTLTPSPAALAHLGVDGVCEPCALLASRGGRLIVGKTVRDGVTAAVATHETHDQDTR